MALLALLLLLLFYVVTTVVSCTLAYWLFMSEETSEATRQRDLAYFAKYWSGRHESNREASDEPDHRVTEDVAKTVRASSIAAHSEDKQANEDKEVSVTEEHMLDFLEQHCCALPVSAANIRVLYSPNAFYEEMLKQIRAARSSIVMSALYLGLGTHTKVFVQCLEDKIRSMAGLPDAVNNVTDAASLASTQASSESFSLVLLLDYNRMHVQRSFDILKNLILLNHTLQTQQKKRAVAAEAEAANGHETAHEGGAGVASTAAPAVSIRIAFYQSHCSWSRLFKPFGRAKEALGVQHTKIFCFDGKHTILTGANLSDDYFTTRMDRYMVLENSIHVASWYTQLVHALVDISHPVDLCEDTDSMMVCDNATGYDPVYRMSDYVRVAQARMHRFARDVVATSTAPMTRIQTAAEATATSVEKQQKSHVPPVRVAQENEAEGKRRIATSRNISDTVLFPTLQFGRLGIRHDSTVIETLLGRASADDHLFLSSPYLNLHDMFVSALMRGGFRVSCITASVETNGWNGQRGLAGYIPFFYLQLERSFYYLMKAYNCLPRVQIREFATPGLTFHAKGVWFTRRQHSGAEAKVSESNGKTRTQPEPDATATQLASTMSSCHGSVDEEEVTAPYLVVYGSSNYGFRSVNKDVEAGAILFTRDAALRGALGQELTYLLQQSCPVTESRFIGTSKGRFQPVVSLMAQLGQDFL